MEQLTSINTGALSRRSLLRGGLAAGIALGAGLPLGQTLLARERVAWPGVADAVRSYVERGRVANMLAVLGFGTRPPETIGGGTLAIGGQRQAGMDTLYRIYSMTKPVTGIAAMILIDEEVLGLDQPVAEILPAFADMKVQRTYDGSLTDLEPARQPITIRHLLTHTAGLGYNIVQKGPIAAEYLRRGVVPGQVSRLPIPGLTRGEPAESLEVFADRLAELPLVLQPGTRWSYSVGLDLMGRVIEVASGIPFDRFLATRIFEPLAMESTWFTVPASEVDRLTTNYAILAGTPIPIDPAAASIYLDAPNFPYGGAGLVSTPHDYDRFLQMLVNYGELDGARVLSEAAVRLAVSNLLPETASTEGTWVAGQGFGAGGRVSDGAFGWGGAAGTVGFVHMPSRLRAGLYTQYMPAEAYPIQRGFPDLVLKDLAAQAGVAAPGA